MAVAELERIRWTGADGREGARVRAHRMLVSALLEAPVELLTEALVLILNFILKVTGAHQVILSQKRRRYAFKK